MKNASAESEIDEGKAPSDIILSMKKKQPNETRLEGFASICSVLVTGLFALTFIFENCVIPSSSMASTLLVGDHVMVDRESLAPGSHRLPLMPYREVKRGDVVVFYKPVVEADGDYTLLVKRVVGVPGDRIHLRNGVVCLNGVAQSEPYAAKPITDLYDPYVDDFPSAPPDGHPDVKATWTLTLQESLQNGDVVVPPDHYFMMGDNRDHSMDSRFWGFVPRENIIGSPLFVYWSFGAAENDELKPALSEQVTSMAYEMLHLFDKTRWSRTLHRIQ
ncbi:signal peptidase I [Acidobacterium sp. S8]|uniref:signal peptidase I n=1 Tax=Acidobacterium sp. S8 TaxID=1641854 RepID=UPI0020B10927|nr:signal peptidase I [Acidobacterium sp. S8]